MNSQSFYQVDPIFPGLTRIWDIARTAMYLVEGKEKAVLIDTGVGVGDLAALIHDLTSKPVTVVLTHGHVDHALGAFGFDDVRMSPLDIEVYQAHSIFEWRKAYLAGAAMQGGDPALLASVSDTDYLPPCSAVDFAPLSPGDRFDLGGVSVEVFRGQGHTPGSLTILIPEWRILLLADVCNQFTFLFERWSSSVPEYREMLLKLKEETQGKYDRVIFSHGNGEGPANMIDSVIKVCDEILAGNADNLPFGNPMGSGLIAKAMDFARFCRADGGTGNVIYDPNKLN